MNFIKKPLTGKQFIWILRAIKYGKKVNLKYFKSYAILSHCMQVLQNSKLYTFDGNKVQLTQRGENALPKNKT